MKTLALATATIGLAFTATPAFADTDGLRSQEISFAGLDLETVEGQQMLDQRIERAARSVCGFDEQRVGTRIRANDARACLSKARASAKRQVAMIIEDQRRGG